MIERHVLVKLTDDYASDAGRAEVLAETQAKLSAIPGVIGLSLGTPADEAAKKAWDVSIIVRFAKIEDVESYRDDPGHRTYVDSFLRPRIVSLKAWNFEVAP